MLDDFVAIPIPGRVAAAAPPAHTGVVGDILVPCEPGDGKGALGSPPSEDVGWGPSPRLCFRLRERKRNQKRPRAASDRASTPPTTPPTMPPMSEPFEPLDTADVFCGAADVVDEERSVVEVKVDVNVVL